MKKVTILCGVSGTGKTHLRTNDPELSKLPFVDIAEAYDTLFYVDWGCAMDWLLEKLKRAVRNHDHVVVEGYFLPGTPSRLWLERELIHLCVEYEFIFLHAPLEVCRERIYLAGESKKKMSARLDVLSRTWYDANRKWRERNE